jgi:hypothetical protein
MERAIHLDALTVSGERGKHFLVRRCARTYRGVREALDGKAILESAYRSAASEQTISIILSQLNEVRGGNAAARPETGHPQAEARLTGRGRRTSFPFAAAGERRHEEVLRPGHHDTA